MPDDLIRALFDPTAPLPTTWPGGAIGIFLLFCVPVGGGIPLGVIMGRDQGLSPAVTALLYLASDVVLALTTEPLLALLGWLSVRVAFLDRLGKLFGRLTGSAGLQDAGVHGPMGLILLAFSVSPTTGRAAAKASGHGFLSGWALAILGDMGYFLVLMATTLWVSSIFGDSRMTIGAVLLGTWVLPLVIRRVRQRRQSSRVRGPVYGAALRATAASAVVGSGAGSALALSPPPDPELPGGVPARNPRKRTQRNGRRRPTRGLHR